MFQTGDSNYIQNNSTVIILNQKDSIQQEARKKEFELEVLKNDIRKEINYQKKEYLKKLLERY